MYGVKGQITLNSQQKQQVHQCVGNNRFVWNELLNMLNKRYENNPSLPMLSEYALNGLLPTLKKEYEFLKISESSSLELVSANLTQSFKNFFKNPTHFKYPRFKAKHYTKKSYTSRARMKSKNIRIEGNYLRLPKLGFVRFRSGRTITAKIKRATITVAPNGKFECSLLVENESQVKYKKTHRSVGIDMGISDLMVLSNGEKIPTIRFDKLLEKKRVYWERRVSRRALRAKSNGISLSESKNYQKAKQQRARIYAKERNQRQDRLHKLTTQLVKDYDIIVLEDLSIDKMMKDPLLARSIAAQSWREIRLMLEYKCERYGKELCVVDPYKTSQICSLCGHDGGKHELSIREWTCLNCCTHHDRDINAAKNILSIGSGRALIK